MKVKPGYSIGRCEWTKKLSFPDKKEALKARKHLRKKVGSKTHPYPCNLCGDWHIGHERRRYAENNKLV